MFNVSVERRNPKDYDAIVKRAAERFLPLAGVAVTGQAKRLTPRGDSGNLVGSITWQIDGMTAEIGTNVEYAEYVEYGARQRSRSWLRGYYGYKPFLRPAIDIMRRKLRDMFARLLAEENKRG